MTKLSIESVGREFPATRGGTPTRALTPVSLSIDDNDFITILGPSGCGKSTLLRIVAGLDRPTEGSVLLDGQPVTGPGAERGVVFQSYTLFPWLTIEENVAFGLREKGIAHETRTATARDWCNRVGLKGFENHYPKQLSGGMQQRTAIARVLANDPKIMLLDEPFGALDEVTRHELDGELRALWERERFTAVLVTHSLPEAVYLAERVLVFSPRPARVVADLATPPIARDAAAWTSDALGATVRAASTALLAAIEEARR